MGEGPEPYKPPRFYTPERLTEITKRSPNPSIRRRSFEKLCKVELAASMKCLTPEKDGWDYEEFVTRRIEDVALFGNFPDTRLSAIKHFGDCWLKRKYESLRRVMIDSNFEEDSKKAAELLIGSYKILLSPLEVAIPLLEKRGLGRSFAEVLLQENDRLVEGGKADIQKIRNELGREARHGKWASVRSMIVKCFYETADADSLATTVMRAENEDTRKEAAKTLLELWKNTSEETKRKKIEYWIEYALRRCDHYDSFFVLHIGYLQEESNKRAAEKSLPADQQRKYTMASISMYSKIQKVRSSILCATIVSRTGVIGEFASQKSCIDYLRILAEMVSGANFPDSAVEPLGGMAVLLRHARDVPWYRSSCFREEVAVAIRPAFLRPSPSLLAIEGTMETELPLTIGKARVWAATVKEALPIMKQTLRTGKLDNEKFQEFVDWLLKTAKEG